MPATRISGACVGCRAKKQKCSGDRSGCAQCSAAGIDCVWPEQRKRGPAKGYIEALEQRLHSAESLLLGILPHIDDALLQEATAGGFRRMSRATSDSSGVDAEDRAMNRSSPPPLNKKTGVEYWENFSLDTITNIRRWQQNCEEHSSIQSGSLRARAQSQTQMTGGFRQYRGDDEMRSSTAAAATIAGMRHSNTTPGTPNSGSASSMMAMNTGSRPMFDTAIAQPASSASLPSHLSHQHPQASNQQQQQSMWYQSFPQQQPPTNQHGMGMNMSMNVDQSYGQNWPTQPPNPALDVNAATAMAPAVRHPQQQQQQQQQQQNQPGSNQGGLYQGDFSQNLFW